MRLTLLPLVLLLSSCTYSVTMCLTHGTANDLVDETSSNTPSTSITPTLTYPSAFECLP